MRIKKLGKCQRNILQEIKFKLNLGDRIICHILKKYTYKIYKIGVIDGYNKRNK